MFLEVLCVTSHSFAGAVSLNMRALAVLHSGGNVPRVLDIRKAGLLLHSQASGEGIPDMGYISMHEPQFTVYRMLCGHRLLHWSHPLCLLSAAAVAYQSVFAPEKYAAHKLGFRPCVWGKYVTVVS